MNTVQLTDAGSAKWRRLMETCDLHVTLRLADGSGSLVAVASLVSRNTGRLVAQDFAPAVFDETGTAFISLDVPIFALEDAWLSRNDGDDDDDDVPFNVSDLQRAYQEVSGRG